MKKEFMINIGEITERIRNLREKLPEVSAEDLSGLNEKLAELDLSEASQAEVSSLQDAFGQLADEVNQTMHRLDQHCDELKENVDDLQNHSMGMKAYAIAQNSK